MRLAKYEGGFGKADNVFPFLTADDPYEASKDEILRAKWYNYIVKDNIYRIEESKILHGDFKPAFMDKCLETVCKAQLPDIVIYIRKRLESDWPESKFIIGCKQKIVNIYLANTNDFIEIKIDTNTIDNLLGLHAYMNSIITNDDLIKQFKLSKVIQNWGIKEGDYAYYMIAPPWVKLDYVIFNMINFLIRKIHITLCILKKYQRIHFHTNLAKKILSKAKIVLNPHHHACLAFIVEIFQYKYLFL